MIKANFKAYGNYVTDSLYQWDLNQALSVTGLNLATAPEVHFSNSDMRTAIVRQSIMDSHRVLVDIPNSLLQHPLRIFAHIGIYEGETFKVVEVVEIPVLPRKKPEDYRLENDDEELYSFNRLENRLENILAYCGNVGGNAELVDIRLAADGTRYTSAGQAVRAQVRSLQEDLDLLNAGGLILNDELIGGHVGEWLEAHPEATTTVQDHSLTVDKMVIGALGYVTPEMFGAKGDGVTDDTAAIQTAVEYCVTAALPLFFPAGHYLVTSTVNIPENVTVQLAGEVSNLSGKKLSDFDGTEAAVVVAGACSPVFELNPGSKLLGGVIYAPNSERVINLDVGTKSFKNLCITSAILGGSLQGSTAIYFDGATGTSGSLCFSEFRSAVHGFYQAYFVDRPSGGLPWLTFCDFSGILSENYKAFTHNLTNYGNAFGSSRYGFTVCGGYVWENADSALLDLIGDAVTVDCKFSDVGAGHNHVYGLDLSHVQKSTVHGVPFNSPLFVAASKNRNNFTHGEMGTVETAGGTLSYVVNGMVAHVFYTGSIPAGSTSVAVPFANLVYAKTTDGEASMETQQHFPNIYLKNSGAETLENVSLSMSVIIH